jgi:hypothetical protein
LCGRVGGAAEDCSPKLLPLPIYPLAFLLRECLLRNVNPAAVSPKLVKEGDILHQRGQDRFLSADFSI